MTAIDADEELMDKVINAVKLEDVVDTSNLSTSFKALISKIHPDKHPDGDLNVKAKEAVQKLLELRDKHKNGTPYEDEAGTFTTNGYIVTFEGEEILLDKSFSNYRKLKALTDSGAKNFHKYMPSEMNTVAHKLEAKFFARAIPIAELKTPLPQVHVNWIYSRMLEFCAWMSQNGYTHCGINPESVFIMPENHGIQVASYYLMTKTGSRISGVSGKYESWYPPQTFSEKKAIPVIDLELCAKTAIYLLGDPSGMGIKLKKEKSVNQKVLDFLISQHDEPGETFRKYRELLSANFKKEFHVLNV